MVKNRRHPRVIAKRGRGRPSTKASTAQSETILGDSEDEGETSTKQVLTAPPLDPTQPRRVPPSKVPKRGSRRGRPSFPSDSEEEEQEETPIEPPPRRRGRPRLKPEEDSQSKIVDRSADYQFAAGTGVVPKSVMKKLAKCLPAMENDDEEVVCGDCGRTLTFWQFRLHNIQCHVNTAPTAEEKVGLTMDHKYFSRKLNEFKRLTKMTVFSCPRAGCESSFKSTLGLAYHMNTCGRSREEIDAVMQECEICLMKFTLPQMQWHRKTHEDRATLVDTEPVRTSLSSSKGNKRKSALLARKTFKRMNNSSKEKDEDDDDEEEDDGNWNSDPDEDEPDEDYEAELAVTDTSKSASKEKLLKSKKITASSKPATGDLESYDFTVLALEFLEGLDQQGTAVWSDPPRIGEDPFLSHSISDNPMEAPASEPEMEQYLPDHRLSVEFNCTTGNSEDDSNLNNYHRLNWFEGETFETSYYSTSFRKTVTSSASVHHTGGPVLSMSWHPSGKLLAVSVAHDLNEELDSLETQKRQSCVQIYRRSGSVLSLQLVVGVDSGYATHLQWSSFCPDIMDSYNPAVESCFDDIEIYARLGYLAMSGEDATVRILSLGIQDLKVPPNFEYKAPYKIKVYRKSAEIECKVDPSVVEDPLGNVVRFDWHEQNKFLAVGYSTGYVAVFDLQTKSPLLLQKSRGEDNIGVTVINPIWLFQGHRLSVRGVLFDPSDPRYLVTCGKDRQMRVWDVLTRSERENKRTGICLDMCWVRGWMHQMVSFENIVSYQSAMHNYVRVFQTGGGIGKPSCAELFNVTSLDFYHGLTAHGTEDGKVGVTYYDWFWRECDYERNRKKKNLAVLSSVEVDRTSYEPLGAEAVAVEVKKLKKSVLHSKLFQRLALNEEEGTYSVSLEAKFGDMDIFDPLPNVDEGEEEDPDSEEEEEEGVTEEDLKLAVDDIKEEVSSDKENVDELLVDDAINSALTKVKDGLLPVYDVTAPKVEPRINISLARNRPSTGVPMEGLDNHQIEEFIRFHNYIRINKVSWSPSGDVIAVGYRNGLITLLPGTFDSIFQT